MDPVRGLIHFGLKVTETTLDRTLDVVRLVDTLLVASAVPGERASTREDREPVWPEEEQADLDVLSATLRARKEPASDAATTAEKKAPARKQAGKASTAKKASSRKTAAPAKKTAARTSAAKKAPAQTAVKKSAAKKTSATTASTRSAPAKKTAARTGAAKKASARPETPSLVVLPDE